MSAIDQQEDVADSSKDDENNLVTGNQVDGSGDTAGMEVDSNQNPNNSTVAANITPTPSYPKELLVGQTRSDETDKICANDSDLTVEASQKFTESSNNKLEKNNVPTETAANNVADDNITIPADTLAVDNTQPSISSTDSPSTPSKLLPETGYKETSLDDVSECDFELKWSEGEDDEAVTSLSDDAIKKLDEELDIDDKLDEKSSETSQNPDKISERQEKPIEEDNLKDISDVEMSETNINKTEDVKKPIVTESAPDITTTVEKTDAMQDKNHKTVEKSTNESDGTIKDLAGEVAENIEEVAIDSEQENVNQGDNETIESIDMSDAEASVSEPPIPAIKNDNIECMDIVIPAAVSEVKSTVLEAQHSSDSMINILSEPDDFSDKILASESQDEKISEIDIDETIVDIKKLIDQDNDTLKQIEAEKSVNNTIESELRTLSTSDVVSVVQPAYDNKSLEIKNDGSNEVSADILDVNPQTREKDIKGTESKNIVDVVETVDIQSSTSKEDNSETDLSHKLTERNATGNNLESAISKGENESDTVLSKECEEHTAQENISITADKDNLTKNIDEFITSDVTNNSIKINTEHRINRPDVMLDIPTQEFDIDDFDDTSDNHGLIDKPDILGNDLTTKTVTEIVNQLSKETKEDTKSSETKVDDTTTNKTDIKVSENNLTLKDAEIIPVEDITNTEKTAENSDVKKDDQVSNNDNIKTIEVSKEISKDTEMEVSPENIDIKKQSQNTEKLKPNEPKPEYKPVNEKVSTDKSKETSTAVTEKEISTENTAPTAEVTDQTKTVPDDEKKKADTDIKATQKDTTDVQPSTSKADQPSTSKSEPKTAEKEKTDVQLSSEPAKSSDNAEEPQEVTDSLGLLAESSRVIDEEEEDEPEPEEEPDDGEGEGDDDDEDFDPELEESSNQTGEHSEESNPPHSEEDIQEDGIDIEFNNEADKIELDSNDATFDALLGDSTNIPDSEIVTLIDSTELSQDAQITSKEQESTVKASEPESEKMTERRHSLLANLLTKPRAELNLPEVAMRVDSANKQADAAVVDLGGSSSDDGTNSKKEKRQTISLIQVAKQIEDAAKKMSDLKEKEAGNEKSKDTKSKPGEIYNLDSDDDEKTDKKEVSLIEKPKEGNQCINHDCTSDDSVPYYLADRMTIAYYGAARRRRRPVCQNCLNIVNSRNEGLVSGIKDMRPLMSLRMSRPTQTLLEISDSDSEGEDEPVGDEGAKYLEEELTDMLNDVWSKYDMDDRLKETEDFLEAELEKMQKQSEEVERLLRECQAATDRVRTELYVSFERPRKELPAIFIHDSPIASYSCLESEEDVSNHPPIGLRYPKRRSSSVIDLPAKKATPAHDEKRTTRSTHEPKPEDDKDVSVVRQSCESAPADLPPAGDPTKVPLRVGLQVYAMKNQYGAWLKGKVLDILPKTNEHQYTMCKVKFEHKVKNQCKQLSARSIAYTEPSDVRMTIGTRVIALFKNSEMTNKKSEFYYSGVIAEIPNPVNKYRYLVFFDDGYAQYVEHKHTRLVYESKTLVWEEVHPFSRDFVCNYLMKYPERPMVRLHPDQAVTVEWNGKWWDTKVMEVDAALVHVRFPDNRTEWIYRGSTRLQPLFTELQAARRGDRARLPRSTKANIKTNVPYVEYTRSEDQPKPESNSEDLRRQRSVAKKSTSTIAQQITSAANDGVTSRVVFYTPKNSVRPLKMVPHKCGPHCKRKDLLTLADLHTYNPLTKPLLSGWERQIIRHKSSRGVMYRAPCGRRLRNMGELHAYLRRTQSDMAVDLFDYNPNTHCLAEFVLNTTNVQKKDLSHGKENIPVPCVNYYDHSLPEFCSYNTERTPTAGVPLNLDPEFLCGCDCDDDCLDKSKCACWKMTLEGARTIGIEDDDVGYHYRRLPEPLPSGIYECNSRCKCKSTCLNRVVQNPLQLKLQVFKTLNRGWGIRALNDVPKGAFICIYAGNLLTDATANLDGLNEGDEYLAELDYIEVVESMKEGYEDDIPEADKKLDKKECKKPESEPESESTESEDEEAKDNDDMEDGDFQPGYMSLGLTEFNKRLRRREKKKAKDEEAAEAAADEKSTKSDNADDCITISDDEEVRVSQREPSRFAAEETMTDNKVTSKYRSIRSYFGEDEACYIMDAKVQGNIGRYLNHSCSPNVFVQNVFVDTHDPRFPWVSFFALHHIRAGTELTWNYNYDIGSVPGKVLYCYCGAANCRGRLL